VERPEAPVYQAQVRICGTGNSDGVRLSNDRKPTAMGHVMIWAIDTRTFEVVAYVTYD
jgi:uncharacterized protein YeaC (DUF1315 family)